MTKCDICKRDIDVAKGEVVVITIKYPGGKVMTAMVCVRCGSAVQEHIEGIAEYNDIKSR